ncbi:MAG: methyltransferase family protein [Minisyncoccota bacterium]
MIETAQTSDSPHVIALPPYIYVSGLAAGLLLQWLNPLPFLPENLAWPIGTTLVVISLMLVTTAMRALREAKTNVDVRKPATRIVVSGSYRFSRNPIYLAMTFFFVGIAALLGALWILLTLIPVLLVLHFGVIMREEAYLTSKFGEEYIQYQSNVRRWL